MIPGLAAWIVDELEAHGVAVAEVVGATLRFTRPQHAWTANGIRPRTDADRQIELRVSGAGGAIIFDPLDADLHPTTRRPDGSHRLADWCATHITTTGDGRRERLGAIVAELLDAITVVARSDAKRAGRSIPAPYRPTPKKGNQMRQPPWPFALVNPTNIDAEGVRDGLRLKLGRHDVEVTTFGLAWGQTVVAGTVGGRPFAITALDHERDVRAVLRRLTLDLLAIHGAGAVAA